MLLAFFMYFEYISVPLELAWTITNKLETTDPLLVKKSKMYHFLLDTLILKLMSVQLYIRIRQDNVHLVRMLVSRSIHN
jgi:hypothetical protein